MASAVENRCSTSSIAGAAFLFLSSSASYRRRLLRDSDTTATPTDAAAAAPTTTVVPMTASFLRGALRLSVATNVPVVWRGQGGGRVEKVGRWWRVRSD